MEEDDTGGTERQLIEDELARKQAELEELEQMRREADPAATSGNASRFSYPDGSSGISVLDKVALLEKVHAALKGIVTVANASKKLNLADKTSIASLSQDILAYVATLEIRYGEKEQEVTALKLKCAQLELSVAQAQTLPALPIPCVASSTSSADSYASRLKLPKEFSDNGCYFRERGVNWGGFCSTLHARMSQLRLTRPANEICEQYSAILLRTARERLGTRVKKEKEGYEWWSTALDRMRNEVYCTRRKWQASRRAGGDREKALHDQLRAVRIRYKLAMKDAELAFFRSVAESEELFFGHNTTCLLDFHTLNRWGDLSTPGPTLLRTGF
ncbi:unnamed protein product [Parnassius apollo]|uniref:(apollo) hypothetical protein n=1 Tax=Parnassius apollo TaxID=110799 RepID=A0A8S3WG93_PARAO|nr:unnamed protein product [Parnassius apollo]